MVEVTRLSLGKEVLMADLKELVLYAWVGEDEFGSGEVGLKQAFVSAGLIPMVAIKEDKINRPYIRSQLQEQANKYRKVISLCKFKCDGVVHEIRPK